MSVPAVPVTLLGGFLGAGKTTLLNRILASPAAGKTAVVVNEFGDLGIDGSLVVGSDDDVVELRNGCLCCTVRGDLAHTVTKLLSRRRGLLRRLKFDRLAVELSGLASPGPVLQTFRLDDQLRAETEMGRVVVLASAPDLSHQLGQHPEAAEQLAYADLVLINHTDRTDETTVAAAEAAVRDRNALTPIERTERARVDVAALLAPTAAFEFAALGFGSGSPTGAGSAALAPTVAAPGEASHAHSDDVSTVSFTSRTPVGLHALKMWLQHIASRRDLDVMRLKGILRCPERPGEAVVAQGLYQWLEIGPGDGPPPEESRLVLIGRGLDADELQRGWRKLTGA